MFITEYTNVSDVSFNNRPHCLITPAQINQTINRLIVTKFTCVIRRCVAFHFFFFSFI